MMARSKTERILHAHRSIPCASKGSHPWYPVAGRVRRDVVGRGYVTLPELALRPEDCQKTRKIQPIGRTLC